MASAEPFAAGVHRLKVLDYSAQEVLCFLGSGKRACGRQEEGNYSMTGTGVHIFHLSGKHSVIGLSGISRGLGQTGRRRHGVTMQRWDFDLRIVLIRPNPGQPD